MKLIERIYSDRRKLEPKILLQAQLNKSAQNVFLAPPRTSVYEKQTSQNTSGIRCQLEASVSPFYSYELFLDSPVSGRLIVIPKTHYGSNRYHSVVTEDGTILSRRGKAVYALGTSKLHGEHEQLGIAVSSPRRGRKNTQAFELAATFSYALFAPTQRLEQLTRRDTHSMEYLLAFLDEAQRASSRR